MVACNRAETEREAREAGQEIRQTAAAAGERLADSWLTTKVQAQFFADDDIKARYISVATRDGVVTLKGHVESESVRQQALQITKNTDGVRQVMDQLTVGSADSQRFEVPDTVPTTGSTGEVAAPAPVPVDDNSIETSIQAKFFLDSSLKARDITVDASGGVVTLRGQVGSDSERAQALILARMTDGVQRVEDGLNVNASLTPPIEAAPGTPAITGTPGSVGTAGANASASAAGVGDVSSEEQLRKRLAQAGFTTIDVSIKDGVVLVQGTVPNPSSKQKVLTMARQTPGAVQVVDRIQVEK
jgi:hyperosmotically inducible protein